MLLSYVHWDAFLQYCDSQFMILHQTYHVEKAADLWPVYYKADGY